MELLIGGRRALVLQLDGDAALQAGDLVAGTLEEMSRPRRGAGVARREAGQEDAGRALRPPGRRRAAPAGAGARLATWAPAAGPGGSTSWWWAGAVRIQTPTGEGSTSRWTRRSRLDRRRPPLHAPAGRLRRATVLPDRLTRALFNGFAFMLRGRLLLPPPALRVPGELLQGLHHRGRREQLAERPSGMPHAAQPGAAPVHHQRRAPPRVPAQPQCCWRAPRSRSVASLHGHRRPPQPLRLPGRRARPLPGGWRGPPTMEYVGDTTGVLAAVTPVASSGRATERVPLAAVDRFGTFTDLFRASTGASRRKYEPTTTASSRSRRPRPRRGFDGPPLRETEAHAMQVHHPVGRSDRRRPCGPPSSRPC